MVKDLRVGQAPMSMNSIVAGYAVRPNTSKEDWRPTVENLTWLLAMALPFTLTADQEELQVGLVEMSTWVRFFWRVPMQTESEVELLGTTVSVTVDPMDETTLVAIRLTGLTSHDFVKQVLKGKSEAGPTWSRRLADLYA